MGYCGSGVSMAGYLGTRTGQKVLGLAEGRPGLDAIEFQTRPLYGGRPWFLAASVAYYRLRDSLGLSARLTGSRYRIRPTRSPPRGTPEVAHPPGRRPGRTRPAPPPRTTPHAATPRSPRRAPPPP